jgi:hypothetical protein
MFHEHETTVDLARVWTVGIRPAADEKGSRPAPFFDDQCRLIGRNTGQIESLRPVISRRNWLPQTTS